MNFRTKRNPTFLAFRQPEIKSRTHIEPLREEESPMGDSRVREISIASRSGAR